MSRTKHNWIKVIGILTLSAGVFGSAFGIYAHSDLTTQYKQLLTRNSYLIEQGYVDSELATKLTSTNPQDKPVHETIINYFSKKDTLNELQQTTQAVYAENTQNSKQILESKLILTNQFLQENPTSSASDVLRNTITTIENYVQNSSTPLQALDEGNQLLTENNEYFALVVAFEKRLAYLTSLEASIVTAQSLLPDSASANNIKSSELEAIIAQLTVRKNLGDKDTATTQSLMTELAELDTKVATINSVIAEEKARIAEIERIRLEQEQIAQEAQRKKEEEAAKYARENDVTYKNILVDISDQTMYLREGQTVINSTPIVTGKPNYETVTGKFKIKTKTRGTVLRSPFPNDPYNVYVEYWMPFFSGYGIHDAPWRNGRFGGNIYMSAGSHGCVNTPPEFLPIVWNFADVGTTVQVIY